MLTDRVRQAYFGVASDVDPALPRIPPDAITAEGGDVLVRTRLDASSAGARQAMLVCRVIRLGRVPGVRSIAVRGARLLLVHTVGPQLRCAAAG